MPPMKFMIKHNLPLVRGGSLWQYRSVPSSCNYGHPTAPQNVNPRTATVCDTVRYSLGFKSHHHLARVCRITGADQPQRPDGSDFDVVMTPTPTNRSTEPSARFPSRNTNSFNRCDCFFQPLVLLLQRVRIARNADCCKRAILSVRSSIRPSVCPSHSGVSSRRMMIQLCGFHFRVGQLF